MTRWMELKELQKTYPFVKLYTENSKVLQWIIDNGYTNELKMVNFDYDNHLLKMNDSMSLAGVMLCYLYEYSPYKRNILFAPRTVGKNTMAINIAVYHIEVKKKYVHVITGYPLRDSNIIYAITKILNRTKCDKDLIKGHLSTGINLKDRIEQIKANDKDFLEKDLLVLIEDYVYLPEKFTHYSVPESMTSLLKESDSDIDTLSWEDMAMKIPQVQILGWSVFGNIQSSKRAARLYRYIYGNYNDSIHFSYMKHHLYTDDNLYSPLESIKTKEDKSNSEITMYLHTSSYEIFGYKNNDYRNELRHLLIDDTYNTELCLNWNEV